MSTIQPEGQQVDAIKQMVSWYKSVRKNYGSGNPFYYLAGYAGSGKTFLAKHFLEELDLSTYDVRLMTFMARSALVLGRASGWPAQTIHSSIYKRVFIDGKETWQIDPDSELRNVKLIVLDECSMIGKKMFQDILSFRKPILILGDPGQLLPIGDDPFFQTIKPDFFLTEIRRQALDNPIIRMSMAAREGHPIPYGDWGKAKRVPFQGDGELTSEEWIGTDIVLTWKNSSRDNLNRTYRHLLGYAAQSALPVKDERVICLRNKHDLQLANGTLATVTKDVQMTADISAYTVPLSFRTEEGAEHEDIPVLLSKFQPRVDRFGALLEDPDFIKKKYLPFDYAYAITIHKSLGSQFNKVIVVDQMEQSRDKDRLLYTAITRAVDQLVIVG